MYVLKTPQTLSKTKVKSFKSLFILPNEIFATFQCETDE